MNQLPHSPTGTTGLQKAFGISIRKIFAKNLSNIYGYLQNKQATRREFLFTEATIKPTDENMIMSIIEKIKYDLSPIVQAYIADAWVKGNKDSARQMKLGDWVPFDKRITRAMQQNAYNYLYKFIKGREQDIGKLIGNGIREGKKISSIAQDIRTEFNIVSWKSNQIARSEVVRTYGQSTKDAIINGGVTQEYKWLTSRKENVCPVCKPLHGKIFNVRDPNAPMPVTSTHPHCNCGIVPYIRIGGK